MFATRFPTEGSYKGVVLIRIDVGGKGRWTQFYLKRTTQSTQFYFLAGFFNGRGSRYFKLQHIAGHNAYFFVGYFNFRGLIVTILDQNLNVAHNGIQWIPVAVLDDDHGQVVFPGALWGIPYNFPGFFIDAEVVFGPRADHIREKVVGYLNAPVRKWYNQLVGQAISIGIIGIGVVDKRFSYTTNVDRGLQKDRGIVATIYLGVGKGISGLDVEFDLFRIGEVEVQNPAIAVGVIHRNDVRAPGRKSVKGYVNVLAGIVF